MRNIVVAGGFALALAGCQSMAASVPVYGVSKSEPPAVAYARPGCAAGTVVGAAAGGVIGSAIGAGSGQLAAIGGGIALGGTAGYLLTCR